MEQEKIKTTLYLEKEIYEKSKIEAIKRHTTTTSIINSALREYLQPNKRKQTKKESTILPAPIAIENMKFDREDLYDTNRY